ncbi:MAG: hypothetical protein K0S34_1042 [Bacillales bacterium]|jgi:hypothetical protein|nr:hypothetical protein [Bacillales bacterium]
MFVIGCTKDTNKEKPTKKIISEYNVRTSRLDTFESKEIKYTSKRNISRFQGTLNNIKVVIEEFYNRNSKIYYYVLKLDQNQIIPSESNSIPYKIKKISVGAMPISDEGIFKINTSSPIFVEIENASFDSEYYYLFENKESLMKDEIRYELVMVNAKPYSKYKIGEKTFRLTESIPPIDDKNKYGRTIIME